MPGRKTRTSRPLLIVTLILCVVLGCVFTQSSANPTPISSDHVPEVFVADNPEEFTKVSDSAVADADQPTQDSRENKPAVTVTPTLEPTKAPTATPVPSQESSGVPQGVWTPNGSNWMFLVDGVPYKGWLTDEDGCRYFFSEEGLMQRGWMDDDGKRYYFNLDGVMQTGEVLIENKSYEFLKDGSLKDYKPKTEKQPEKKKYIALTFDDGPGSFTGRLLDCLEENKAKATFFMVGTEIVSFPEEVKRMAELGMELGNHTYNHLDLTKLTLSQTQSEIGDVDQTLLDLTAQGASVVRPPYGSINSNVKASVGTPMILWSIDTLDWKTQDTQSTVDTVMSQAQDGSIILMHDIYSQTVDAAEILIPKLIEEGYELVTIHELAQKKGIDLKPGIAYGEMN